MKQKTIKIQKEYIKQQKCYLLNFEYLSICKNEFKKPLTAMTNQRHKQQNKVGKKDTRADEDEKNNYKSIL